MSTNSMSKSAQQTPPEAPDGGWGWMVVLGGFIVCFCTTGGIRSLGVLFLTFRRQFSASSAETAWVTSIMMGVMSTMAVFATALAGTIGFRPTIMLGGVFYGAGYIISAFATRVFHLYLTIGCLSGLGCAFTFSAVMAIIGQYFSRRRAMANSIALLGGSLSSMVFPPLFQYLLDEYGLQGTLLLLGGISLNSAVAGALVRPLEIYKDKPMLDLKTLEEKNSKEVVESDLTMETATKKKISGAAIRFFRTFLSQMDFKLVKIPAVALFFFSSVLFSFNSIVPSMYIVPRAKYLQIEDYEATFLLSTISIADMVGRVAVGFVPNDIKLNRLDQYGLLLCFLGLANLLSPLATTYPGLIAYATAQGVCFGAFVPTLLTCLAELVGPKRYPSAVGLLMLLQGVASLSGPPIAGWLYDVTNSYDATFLLAGACFLLAGLLPFLLRLRKKTTPAIAEDVTNTTDAVKGHLESDVLLVYETTV